MSPIMKPFNRFQRPGANNSLLFKLTPVSEMPWMKKYQKQNEDKVVIQPATATHEKVVKSPRTYSPLTPEEALQI